MIIYDKDGVLLLDIEVDDTSVRYKAINGENSLTLKFSLAEHMEFPLGSWCVFKGDTYSLMASSDITMHHRRNFEYNLVMYGDEARAKRYMFINPVSGDLKFVLTAYPEEHLQMFVDNMNNREPIGKKDWTIGDCVEHERITLSYNHTFCHDALVQLANELELDYWFDGKAVSLGKLEVNKDNPLPLSYGGDGEGLKSGIKRTNYSNALPIEILYVQGTTTNIDASKYRTTEERKTGFSQLLLPQSYSIGYDGVHFSDEEGFDSSVARWYVTDANGYSVRRSDKEQTTFAEDSLDCTEITPTKEEKVEQVIVVDEEQHFYDLLFKSDTDYKNYQIGGETAYIVFQTGMLAGKEFDLATNDAGTIICKKEDEFWRIEIKPQEIDGITMPDPATDYMPLVGETFKVFGVQLPDEYVTDAELSMLKYAVKHLYANEVPQYTISGELDEIYLKRNWSWLGEKIVLGGYVSFSDKSFQEEPILIRITGIKEYVNKPYSSQLELSNQNIGGTLIGTLNRIENQEVYNEALYRKSVNFSKRRFRDAQETISMLAEAFAGYSEGINPITVRTMAMLVGNESNQFKFTKSLDSLDDADCPLIYDVLTKQFMTDSVSYIKHMTLEVDAVTAKGVRTASDYLGWQVDKLEPINLEDGDARYVYIKASKSDKTAEFVLSKDVIAMDAVNGYYHFVVGILNSEIDGKRDFVTLYGFTEVLPGQITTDLLRSGNGKLVINLADAIISAEKGATIEGAVKIEGGSLMTSRLDVGDDESVEAFFNGGDFAKDTDIDPHTDKPCGKLILAAGIPDDDRTLEERAQEATTRIYEDGCTFTKNLHLQEGCTVGDIHVTQKGISIDTFEGEGTFTLNSLGLTAENSLSEVTTSLSTCSNTAITVDKRGGTCYHTYAPGTREDKKVALFVNDMDYAVYAPNGMYAGFRPQTRDLPENPSEDMELSTLDHTVFAVKGTVLLPYQPEMGQVYRIWHYRGGTDNLLTIKAQRGKIFPMKGTTATERTAIYSSKLEVIELLYGGANWYFTIDSAESYTE